MSNTRLFIAVHKLEIYCASDRIYTIYGIGLISDTIF